MSPIEQEPGHATQGWTHRICLSCWNLRGREPNYDPHTVKDDEMAPCCFCGTLTDDGIYVRQKASEVHHR